MKQKNSDKTILTGLEYLDDDILSGVLQKINTPRVLYYSFKFISKLKTFLIFTPFFLHNFRII